MPIVLSAPFIIPETGFAGDLIMGDVNASGSIVQSVLKNEPPGSSGSLNTVDAGGSNVKSVLKNEPFGSANPMPINAGGL